MTPITLTSITKLEPSFSKAKPKNSFSLDKKEKNREDKTSKAHKPKKEEEVPTEAFIEKPFKFISPLLQENTCIDSKKTIEAATEILSTAIVHKEKQGISTTTLTLQDHPHLSILSGTMIELVCYDTAPMSLQINFFSSPQGALFLSSHLSTLHENLQKAFPDTFFSIAKPLLQTTSSKDRRKEKESFQEKAKKTDPFI